MTYPRHLRPDQLTALAPVLEGLTALEPGQVLVVREEPSQLSNLRYLLYAYLAGAEVTRNFKVRVMSSRELRIEHRGSLSPQVDLVGPVGPSETVLTFVQDHLLEVEDELVAREIVAAAVASGTLAAIELVPVLTEWRRWSGQTATEDD